MINTQRQQAESQARACLVLIFATNSCSKVRNFPHAESHGFYFDIEACRAGTASYSFKSRKVEGRGHFAHASTLRQPKHALDVAVQTGKSALERAIAKPQWLCSKVELFDYTKRIQTREVRNAQAVCKSSRSRMPIHAETSRVRANAQNL